MKILQVIGGGEKGGSRSHIVELCKGLAQAGHTTEIICFMEDAVAASAREENIPLVVIPMKNIFDLRAVEKLKDYIRERQPDLVHTHGVRANFIGRLGGKAAGVPVVTTVHSSIYQDYSTPLKKLLYHRIEKLTRKYTYRFIAVAGSLKKELEGDGISGEKIDVVYNGISPDFVKEIQGPSLKEELGVPEETPVIITIGRMEPVKNQEMFLKVCAFLKERGRAFHGVIVGDGPLSGSLKSSAATLGLEGRVSFLGFRKDIFRLLSGSDIFLLTSRMEGLPITLLEAMAAGIPVLVTNVGGMPEVMRLAKNGWTFEEGNVKECGEKVTVLLENPGLRRQMASLGQAALGKYFSHQAFMANTVAVYERVLGEVRR